jgi:hypothetical protein
MLPFGVTIPATVPQGSEIPEGLMNNPVYGSEGFCAVTFLSTKFVFVLKKSLLYVSDVVYVVCTLLVSVLVI